MPAHGGQLKPSNPAVGRGSGLGSGEGLSWGVGEVFAGAVFDPPVRAGSVQSGAVTRLHKARAPAASSENLGT